MCNMKSLNAIEEEEDEKVEEGKLYFETIYK